MMVPKYLLLVAALARYLAAIAFAFSGSALMAVFIALGGMNTVLFVISASKDDGRGG